MSRLRILPAVRILPVVWIVLLAGLGNPAHAQQPPVQNIATDNPSPVVANQDCGSFLGARIEAQRNLEGDREALETGSLPKPTSSGAGVRPARIDLLRDLRSLDEAASRFTQCINGATAGSVTVPRSCSSEQILNFQMNHQGEMEREIPIMRISGDSAFFY